MKQQLIQTYLASEFTRLNINKEDVNYVYFWKPKPAAKGVVDEACCCQWWFSNFTLGGRRFPTAEHAMMYRKAEMFNDRQAMAAIKDERHPYAVKAIGRQVQNFNSVKWDSEAPAIVTEINYEKFMQDVRLRDWMLSLPDNTVFVEASPFDRIWGIGLADDGTVDLSNPNNWQGCNKLGFALTEVLQRVKLGVTQ